MPPGPRTPEWRRLEALAAARAARHVRDEFAGDPTRFETLSRGHEGFLLDFSRQRLDVEVLTALVALADAVNLRGAIEAMYRGDPINRTEGRAVLHVALRQPAGAAVGGAAIEREVLAERERMLAFASSVRAGPFDLVVNIGIGGSDLGPAMAVQALRSFARGGPRVEFVSNVDGCRLADLLESADPARTLFLVASKTFTTQETLANAHAAREWVVARLGAEAVPSHFAAVSVNREAMDAFGVHPEYRFRMWDWVGGRYSLWSSIGVSIAIAVGPQAFEQLLAGAHAMDRHFREAPWSENLPVLLALLGVWNVNFLQLPTLAVLPYDDRLACFPAFLQQLDMESNGKSTTLDGERLDWATGPVIWGEPANNAQHSFFQLLHQGTPRAAVDFLLPARSSCGRPDQHTLAVANCLAQAEALMQGQQGVPTHRVHDGDRPVSILVFDRLDPHTLGGLVALHEHKVFAQSVIWGINAFDQWGVELGKKLCAAYVPAVRDGAGLEALPARLRAVLTVLRSGRDA
jgi:glucose-6-phosphate isomerase